MKNSISVVVPCYNEGEKIYKNMNELLTYLSKLDIERYEVVAVNDGSKDNTLEELNRVQSENDFFTVISNDRNQGKGFAVKTGVFAASYDLVCFLDADLSTRIEEIEVFLDLFENEMSSKDGLIGSRSKSDSNIEVPQPYYRRVLGKGFAIIRNGVLPLGQYQDTQCGFKMFTKDTARSLFDKQSMKGFSFDTEILYIAYLKGYSIEEVPITWRNDDSSTVNPIKDSFKMFRDLFLIRYKHRRLREEVQ